MKKTKRKNGQKGITLIALIITIIVLIILAGISIAMISGQDGILNRAGRAKTQNDIEGTKEQIKLELIGKYDANGKYTNADLIDEVEKVTGNPVTEKTGRVKTKNGNYMDISDLWVTSSTTGGGSGNTETISKIEIGKKYTNKSEYSETDTGYKITIPGGYTIADDSATKIKDGVVIKDESGNEFVWVPVPNAIANTEADITTMVNNKQYPIAVKTGSTDSNGKTAYRGVLYDFSSSGGTVSMTPKSYSATSGYREPAYLTDTRNGDASTDGKSYLRNIVGMTQTDDTELKTAWTNQMQTEFDEMVEKVASAGGYYISRYEISGSIDSSGNITTESKPNATALTGGTTYKNNKLTWYGLYKAGKSYTHDGIGSTMIWGSQYDQMMIWMAKNGIDVTKEDSTNYNQNSTITGVSGSKDVINKVYDLYGGRCEWTLEARDTFSRVARGGGYNSSFPATRRSDGSPTDSEYFISTRATLYVK